MEQSKRYSEQSEYELRNEIAQLKEKARKAEQMGMVNEFAVLERKVLMAQAYLLDPKDFKSGETFDIVSAPGEQFTISYLNGVFAWGYRSSSPTKEEGIPISMLRKVS